MNYILIKYLPDFNEFTNFMIDNYSYKVSRDEASNKLIKDEENYKNNQFGFKDMFNKFKNIWKKMKPYATKYECKDDMPQIDLDENKSLAHFLIDNEEWCKGMYIAAAYQKFIDWQNSFLDGLIEPLRLNGILHHFVKDLEKKIDIQNAKKNEVLNFDKINESFIEIIFENSKRNIFMEDNKINYLNYKQFVYDFESIEKMLGEILLPGKVKFNENLKFVTYCFEGFRGNKSSLMTNFEEKYNKSKPLSNEKKTIIYNTIKDNLENKNNELTKILFSIQLLIYYLTQEKKSEDDEIKVLIANLPEYVILSKECKEFFEKQELKVEELSNVYSYIELLCFKPIINNLKKNYKKEIDIQKSDSIKNLFEENKLKHITKIDLASACRKLISRYLVGVRDDTDINENNLLVLHLDREELWSKETWKKKDLLEKDLDSLSKYELTIDQCYELYELLGGDESKALEGININIEKEKDENNEKPNEEGNIKILKKKRNVIW